MAIHPAKPDVYRTDARLIRCRVLRYTTIRLCAVSGFRNTSSLRPRHQQALGSNHVQTRGQTRMSAAPAGPGDDPISPAVEGVFEIQIS